MSTDQHDGTMAETDDMKDGDVEEVQDMDETGDGDGDKSKNKRDKSAYRQKYKHAWELEIELRDWLTSCRSDSYAAFCKFCRTKLHAHKKGLLAHAKSAKHKKHVENPFSSESLALMPSDLNISNRSSMMLDDFDDSDRGIKRNVKGQRLFNDNWLSEPQFEAWLRKVPNNNTRALCIACRCIISAGRCELIKHTRAAKHQKALAEGPFEELSEADLQWVENVTHDQSLMNSSMGQYGQQINIGGPAVDTPGLPVNEIIDRLDKHVPLDLAEKWDNVGIIVQPSEPTKVYNILLTIDLNEKIVEEAIKKRAQFIIAYHPPIFNAIKSLKPAQWMNKAILKCIEHKITVYSPHTALDAVKGGINDWLVSSFVTSEGSTTRPITYSSDKKNTSCLEVLLSEPQETVAPAFSELNNVTLTEYGNSSTDVRVSCDDKTLPQVVEHLAQKNYTQLCSRVTQLVATPIAGVGMGRVVKLGAPLPLYEVVQRTKTHLDLTYIRLALSPKHTRDTRVNSIAVCAGSGSSVLKVCQADVWITGEMSHHDVLDAINKGITVILCEHTNTERGFLREWSQQLRSSVFEDQVYVSLSEIDRDPIRIV